MSEFWIGLFSDYGLFLLKVATIVIAFAIIIGLIAAAVASSKKRSKKGESNIKLSALHEEYQEQTKALKKELMDGVELKLLEKKEKEEKKAEKKAEKARLKQGQKAKEADEKEQPARVYVIDFDGDINASEAESLREQITALLSIATEKDEVVIRLESPGGVVHGYGLAASQLQRLRDQSIPLTVCVDKVAASGGYMMACIGNKIISAPFAIIGSIGVVAQLPNFNRLLKKNDIDYEQFTAGEFKRTVTILGENTDKAKEKFQEELEETHVLFKNFVAKHRPQLDVAKVATGEHWFGEQALALNLVDEIKTSDSYLLEKMADFEVYELIDEEQKSLPEKIGEMVSRMMVSIYDRLLSKNLESKF